MSKFAIGCLAFMIGGGFGCLVGSVQEKHAVDRWYAEHQPINPKWEEFVQAAKQWQLQHATEITCSGASQLQVEPPQYVSDDDKSRTFHFHCLDAKVVAR